MAREEECADDDFLRISSFFAREEFGFLCNLMGLLDGKDDFVFWEPDLRFSLNWEPDFGFSCIEAFLSGERFLCMFDPDGADLDLFKFFSWRWGAL